MNLKKKKKQTLVLTLLYSQDWLHSVVKASTHGADFVTIRGRHFTSVEMFFETKLPAKK